MVEFFAPESLFLAWISPIFVRAEGLFVQMSCQMSGRSFATPANFGF
jgi:hypothetical protein